MLFYFSLIILILVLVLQITRFAKQSGLFGFKYIFIISIFIIFGLLFEQSFQQYQVWSQNEISKFLLPPYQTLNYFVFYVFTRFFVQYLISLATAIIFLIVAKTLNKKYEERFFKPEEFYLAAAGIFLVGYPGMLFYLVLLLILAAIGSIILSFIKPGERFSLNYLWLPLSLFVILIVYFWLGHTDWWEKFIF